MLSQSLQSFTIPIQCRRQILIIFLQLHVVNLCCVLLLFALFQLSLCLLNLLSDIGKEQILVEPMDIS